MVALILAPKESKTTTRLRRRRKTPKSPRKTGNSSTPRNLFGSNSRNSPVFPDIQILRLREELKKVALNQKFLLHGGDCAEAFAYSSKVSSFENCNLISGSN